MDRTNRKGHVDKMDEICGILARCLALYKSVRYRDIKRDNALFYQLLAETRFLQAQLLEGAGVNTKLLLSILNTLDAIDPNSLGLRSDRVMEWKRLSHALQAHNRTPRMSQTTRAPQPARMPEQEDAWVTCASPYIPPRKKTRGG